MGALSGKTILVLSPQAWGKMFISKHHYAVELAKYGNKVFFLNPPNDPRSQKQFEITPSGVHENLFIISHRLRFPFNLKFHAIKLFHILMKGHLRNLLRQTGHIDIVWSFDLGNLYPFRYFQPGTTTIFHPVDEPLTENALASAAGAQYIFSVTREILNKYSNYRIPGHHIHHGVAEYFIPQRTNETVTDQKDIHVGFSGNLLRNDIDRETFLKIVKAHPDVTFECWGSYNTTGANIGGIVSNESEAFIARLLEQKNVVLHGAIPPGTLALELKRMDAFLICYDIAKDQSKGTNYHKIMEYLAIGKVIVSNNVTTYKNLPDLIQMTSERENNDKLPELFAQVINNIEIFNTPKLVQGRQSFARQNTYHQQIKRIEELIDGEKV